jgi:uncharacterized protein (DUF58 family)
MQRRHNRAFSLAEPSPVELTLSNRSAHPLRGRLQDNVPGTFERSPAQLTVAVPPRAEAQMRYELTPYERGRFRFQGAVLRAYAPLGLAFRDYRLSGVAEGREDADGSFAVYPSVRSVTPLRVAAFARRVESGYHRLQRQVEGTTPSQIRPWMSGDSYREVNWKVSARYDRPMVTQYDTERNQVIYVFVDCGRLMRSPVGRLRKLDYAASAAADLARVAISRGDQVGLCCFSGQIKAWLAPKSRRRQLLAILEALAGVDADNTATDYVGAVNMFLRRVKRRALCVFLTSFTESESTWELMRRLRSLRPRHVPAVISLSDPSLQGVLRSEPASFAEVCRKLAAADLREEVDLFAQELRQHHGHFLQTGADSLSVAAVQAYLNSKSRGLL